MLLSNGVTTKEAIIGTVVLVVLVFIYVTIKDKINRKKAGTGEDKQMLWSLLERALPDVANYTRVYGCWEWTTYQGKRKTTKYWYYGLAFNEERLCIVPLSCEAGDVSYSSAYSVEKGDLGMINTKKEASWVEFYDKNNNEIVSLSVFPENLRDDKYHPLNIIQKDEAQAFLQWKDKWADEVNAARGVEVTGKMRKPLKNGTFGIKE